MTTKIIEKSYGYRVDHTSGGYTDHIMALGMASLHAVQEATHTWGAV